MVPDGDADGVLKLTCKRHSEVNRTVCLNAVPFTAIGTHNKWRLQHDANVITSLESLNLTSFQLLTIIVLMEMLHQTQTKFYLI